MIVSLVLANLMVFKYRTAYVSRGDYILFTVVSLIPLLNIIMMYLAVTSFWEEVLVPKKGFGYITDWLDTTINPEKK